VFLYWHTICVKIGINEGVILMNREELEEILRGINPNLDVEKVLKTIEEKEQEINLAHPITSSEYPSLLHT
jgi:hypothetical protein